MRSMVHKSMLTAATATALVAALAAPAAAQSVADGDVRPNSWYWGMYGGQTSFATSIASTNAPMFGIEWTVTRSKFALNLFAEQAFFQSVSTVKDPSTSGTRRVDIQNMRRVGGSGMFFLPPYRSFHPWIGGGYAFNFIPEATPQGSTYASVADRDTTFQRVNDGRAQGNMFADMGVMLAVRRWAPFVSYTLMPTKGTGSWMVNGEGFTNIWKLGFKYSLGSAIQERW